MNEIIKLNGVLLPNPVRLDIECTDIDSKSSVYSETGQSHRNIIRKNVYRLNVSWKLSESLLSDALKSIGNDSVTVDFLNPETGTLLTKEMYCREKYFSCIGFENSESWWNLEIKLIEY